MLVTWCGSPVVIPGTGGGSNLGGGRSPFHRPPELFHPGSAKGCKLPPRPQYRYSEQVVSYEPLVHTVDLYRNNLMLNAPRVQKEMSSMVLKCPPPPPVRRHSHDQSDFDTQLFNLNNLNKAKSCHNTPRKVSYNYIAKEDSSILSKGSGRKEVKEEVNRSRSILRRSSSNWCRKKSQRQSNQHRLSLPSLRDPSKPRQVVNNNYSSSSEINKVRRSSTSVGENTRRNFLNRNVDTPYSAYHQHQSLDLYPSSSPQRTTPSKPASGKQKRVSINLNEVIGSNSELRRCSPSNSVAMRNKKNLEIRNSFSSSHSSSSSASSSSGRQSSTSLQNRTLAKIRGLQR